MTTRTQLTLAFIAALTFMLSPNGRAEKLEEKNASRQQSLSERIDLRDVTARAYAGNAQAQFSLGLIYEEGRGGIKRDLAYALSWYEEAARNGLKVATDRIRNLEKSIE